MTREEKPEGKKYDPADGTPPQPGYGTPQQPPQPGYGTPQQPPQPGYGTPQQPPQPGYGTPQQPPQPGYGTPQQPPQPGYGTPQQPPQPGYGTPQQPPQPGYGTPQQPPQPGYGTPPPSPPQPSDGTPPPQGGYGTPQPSPASDGTPQPPAQCKPLPPGDNPPTLPPAETCPIKCDCPSKPTPTETCFDVLIAQQTIELNKAEHAKTFKADLEDLLKKANAAKQAYSRDKYEDFKKRWLKEHELIHGVIETVTCNLKCWWCLIECEICPLLYTIKGLDAEINGDGKSMKDVHSLLDLQYWHQRNRDAKTAQFERFKAVLAAWSNPVETIEKALVANDKIIKSITTLDRVDAVLQVFLKLIPMHLAISPRPLDSTIIDAKYKPIDAKYIDLCCCDKGLPDDCCGPDAGVMSVRLQQLVGPQAYIVDPNAYFDILCCLAKDRYLPAKDQLAKAASDLATVTEEIARKKADLERRKKNILEDALRSIVKPVDCDKHYTAKDSDTDCGCGSKTTDPTTQNPPSPARNPALPRS